MHLQESDNKTRQRLRELKEFYTNLLIYGAVCASAILVWLSMGMGPFWPIWVVIGCGITIALKGISLGQIPQLDIIFPFLNDEWEEKQFHMNQNESISPLVKKVSVSGKHAKQKMDVDDDILGV